MSRIEDIKNEATAQISEYVNSAECRRVSAEECGLDLRCGQLTLSQEGEILIESHKDATLQYYGGFEYIDATDRVVIGDWVVYSGDSDRVSRCFEWLEEEQED